MAGLPLYPRHPERICWGCDKFCRADDLACGNGTIRTPHPIEFFGDDWQEWARDNDVDIEEDPSFDPTLVAESPASTH